MLPTAASSARERRTCASRGAAENRFAAYLLSVLPQVACQASRLHGCLSGNFAPARADRLPGGQSREDRSMNQPTGSLRKECLNFTGITAMAIALISPTMTAALIVPLMYSSAGNASWLAYLFGTVMLLFVALNLSQFAR